jgi:hypothetical protein
MPDELTLEDLARFRALGEEGYLHAVITLFMSGRATGLHWAAMARAVLHVSESSNGHLVLEIDRAILRHLEENDHG